MASKAGSTWNKQTVYHSALVIATEDEPLRVKFLARPRNGRKPGTQWVPFRVEGDDWEKDYQLNIDNPAIGALLETVPLDVWVNVTAGGTKVPASQTLAIDGASVTQGRTLSSEEEAKAPPAPPPNGASERHYDRQTTLYAETFAALTVARQLQQDYIDTFGEPIDENTRALAMSLYIEYNRGGASRTMTKETLPKPKRFQKKPEDAASEQLRRPLARPIAITPPATPPIGPVEAMGQQAAEAASDAAEEKPARGGRRKKAADEDDDLPF